MLRPGQVGAGEHAAAGFDRRELVRVADENRFGAGCCGGGQELAEVIGPDHGGFVDDDQALTAELQLVVA
jgi:hypothetical protein